MRLSAIGGVMAAVFFFDRSAPTTEISENPWGLQHNVRFPHSYEKRCKNFRQVRSGSLKKSAQCAKGNGVVPHLPSTECSRALRERWCDCKLPPI